MLNVPVLLFFCLQVSNSSVITAISKEKLILDILAITMSDR